jgi:hypothetical protein
MLDTTLSSAGREQGQPINDSPLELEHLELPRRRPAKHADTVGGQAQLSGNGVELEPREVAGREPFPAPTKFAVLNGEPCAWLRLWNL